MNGDFALVDADESAVGEIPVDARLQSTISSLVLLQFARRANGSSPRLTHSGVHVAYVHYIDRVPLPQGIG
jgi:hypothetical protein